VTPLSPEVARLVRYCHPAKILATTRLPGLDAIDDAALYGISQEQYRSARAALREEVTAAARALGEPPRLAGPVLALGDSHTDELGSWAEILGELVPVLNAGLSGDTTTSALARAHRLPPAAHAVVLLGTNDARRHGGAGMLVSHRETRRNLRALDTLLRQRYAKVTWMTPPPVDEPRIRADPALRDADVSWRRADVRVKAQLVLDEWPDAIDLWPGFAAEHLAADGLHPSPCGQLQIARRVTVRASQGDSRARRGRRAARRH
jgi:lysophospholipase L1-like esterase